MPELEEFRITGSARRKKLNRAMTCPGGNSPGNTPGGRNSETDSSHYSNSDGSTAPATPSTPTEHPHRAGYAQVVRKYTKSNTH